MKHPGQAVPSRIQYRLCSKIGLPSVGMTILMSSKTGLGSNSIFSIELDEVHSAFSIN
jgi:hypothetical protein